MSLDLADAFDWIEARVHQDLPVEEHMAELIRFCEERAPHPDWAVLRDLDYGSLHGPRAWFSKALGRPRKGRKLTGLWFGLYNPVRRGKPTADLYISGSRNYRPGSEDAAWAVRPHWLPMGKDLKSPVLASIYKTAYGTGRRKKGSGPLLGNRAEYPLCLAYGCFVVAQLLREMEIEELLVDRSYTGVAVGFDGGDAVRLGELRRDEG